MNQHLKLAQKLGAHQAQLKFQEVEKVALQAASGDWGEGTRAGNILTPILGGLPLVGSPLAGYASGKTTPLAPDAVQAMTASGSAMGQAIGGLGGAGLGAGLGAGGAAIAKHINPKWDVDPRRAAAIGALLGGTAGLVGGGAYGAHQERKQTEEAARQQVMQELTEQIQARRAQALQNRATQAAIQQAHQVGQMSTLQRLQQMYAQQQETPEAPKAPA